MNPLLHRRSMTNIFRPLNRVMRLARSGSPVIAALLLAIAASPAPALDVVHRKSTEKVVGGDITKITRAEIVVTQKVGNKEETIPANDISYIEWDSEPGPLKLARGSENTGNLDESIRQYQEAAKAVSSGRDGLKLDVEFGRARAMARRALRTAAELPEAISQLKAFVNSNREHYRYYDAQLLLGEALLASKDGLTADVSFESVAESPWPDYQMAGQLGLGRSALSRGEVAPAKELFDAVAGTTTKTPAEAARKLEGMLGQSRCLLAQMDHEAALKILEQVIEQSIPSDTRIQAEAYVLQGDAYRLANSSPKSAVIAYLHVDVIPDLAAESDLHAESLYQLSLLWTATGDAGRGADAAARLQSKYADSEWARKITESGSTP